MGILDPCGDYICERSRAGDRSANALPTLSWFLVRHRLVLELFRHCTRYDWGGGYLGAAGARRRLRHFRHVAAKVLPLNPAGTHREGTFAPKPGHM